MKARPDVNDILREHGAVGVRALNDSAQPYVAGNACNLVVKCADSIAPEEVKWLWDRRIPLGKLSLIAGYGGLGKTMVLIWITATVSRGGEWPCGEGWALPGSTIFLSTEDGAADTLVPRLMAADADLSKVRFVSAVRVEDDGGRRGFNLQLDLPELEKLIAEIGDVVLVVIDPITSYLGKVDSHNNADLRAVLDPLAEMAARLDVTVLANTHFSKGSGNANSLFIGSVAFINSARAAYVVTEDPEDRDRRLFLPSKMNLARKRDGLAYRIAEKMVGAGNGAPPFFAPYVKWEPNPITITADEAVASSHQSRTPSIDEAKKLLREILATGPEPVEDIKRQAHEAGISWATMRRAKDELGVESKKGGLAGGWVWRLKP